MKRLAYSSVIAYFSIVLNVFFLHNEIYKYQITMQRLAPDNTRHDIMALAAGHTDNTSKDYQAVTT